jgi:hypothetical protein
MLLGLLRGVCSKIGNIGYIGAHLRIVLNFGRGRDRSRGAGGTCAIQRPTTQIAPLDVARTAQRAVPTQEQCVDAPATLLKANGLVATFRQHEKQHRQHFCHLGVWRIAKSGGCISPPHL